MFFLRYSLIVSLFVSQFSWALDYSQFPKFPLKKFLSQHGRGEPTYFEALKNRKKFEGRYLDDSDHPGFSVEGKFEGQTKPFRYLGCKNLVAGGFVPCFGKADFLKNYEKEVLISVDGEKIWIPMQKKLFGDFLKDVKTGDQIVVQLRYWGYLIGHKQSDDSLLVFAVGFESH